MPDGYRTDRFGLGGRILFGAMLMVAVLAIGLSAYVLMAETMPPERGAAGAVTANSGP